MKAHVSDPLQFHPRWQTQRVYGDEMTKTHLATEVFHRAIFTSSQVMLLSKAIFRLRRYVSFKLLLQNAAYIFKLIAISYSMD